MGSNKVTGADKIPVVGFKKLNPELSPILPMLFNCCCLKEKCFLRLQELSAVYSVFNAGVRLSPL